MDSFFKKMKTKNVSDDDNIAIMRRLNLNNDWKLRMDEFSFGVLP
jgi:hypothetical protein